MSAHSVGWNSVSLGILPCTGTHSPPQRGLVIADPGIAPYVATKHGVIGLTRAAAIDYAKAGIRVNALAPGLVESPMTRRAIGAQCGARCGFVRRASQAQRRHLSDDALLVHIKAVHAETRGGYGGPRIWNELLARGIRGGKERVQKLMQLHGLRARGKRRFKVTTDSNLDLPITPRPALQCERG